MEEELQIDPVYKKGFEHGYWLRRGDSQELKALIDRAKNHEGYHSGLKAVQKEAERELFLEEIQQIDKERENDKEQERD